MTLFQVADIKDYPVFKGPFRQMDHRALEGRAARVVPGREVRQAGVPEPGRFVRGRVPLEIVVLSGSPVRKGAASATKRFKRRLAERRRVAW